MNALRATAVLALLGAGCGHSIMVRAIEDLGTRAAFDLECPKEQLKFEPLGNSRFTDRETGFSRAMGVSGCGRRGAYLYETNGVWVLNSHPGERAGR